MPTAHPWELHLCLNGWLELPTSIPLCTPAPPLRSFLPPHSYCWNSPCTLWPRSDTTFSMKLSLISSSKRHHSFLRTQSIDLHFLVCPFLYVIFLCDLCPLNRYHVFLDIISYILFAILFPAVLRSASHKIIIQ